MDKWMNEGIHEWTNERMNAQTNKWVNEWTHKRTNEWVNEIQGSNFTGDGLSHKKSAKEKALGEFRKEAL